MSKRKTPVLRFKGFHNDWEQRKLGDIAKRIVRKNKNLKSTLVLTISAQYGLVDQKKFFNKNIAGKNIAKYYLIEKGEFAYNKSYSKGHPLGVIKRLDYYDVGILSTLYIIFKPENINSNFLSAYYDTKCWYKEVTKYAAEGARNHGLLNIPTQDFFKTELIITTNNKEQQRIGNIIKIVNKILDLQERKYEELKLLKKALLQNMFANKTAYPKLRFNGFNSKWKSYKLKEIGKIVTGNTPPTKDLNNYSDHGMLWVTPTDITGPIIRNTVKRLSPIGITKARTAKEGSILVTCIASIGKNALTETRCGFNQQINAVIPNQYNDSYFLLIQSKFWSKKAKQIAAKGTIKIVNKKDFSNLSFLYPKLKEQKNMSSFFKLLDMVTTFQMKNLIELKKIKHFLLQNMFI